MLGTRLRGIQRRLDEFNARPSLTGIQRAWSACIQQAIQSGMEGNYSVGSVIVDSEQKIVSRGRNSVFEPIFRSDAHAEMNAISQLETSLPSLDRSGLVLFSTLEPCLMCTARILLSGICNVFFLQQDRTAGCYNQFHLLPLNFKELGNRARFIESMEDPELVSMGKDLYEIGEEIWNVKYQIDTEKIHV